MDGRSGPRWGLSLGELPFLSPSVVTAAIFPLSVAQALILQRKDVFAGDASIEPKRAAGGNALRFEKKTNPTEMPPNTQVLSSTPDVSSEDLFTPDAVQEHFVLNLTSVQEERDEDMTVIDSEQDDTVPTGECILEQPITGDGEPDEPEFPNLQPVQPSEIYSSRQIASLTPAERLCLIRRKKERSNYELLGRELMETSRKNMESLLENSNEHFKEEMQWKKLYLEEMRSNFKELIGVLKEFTNTYKEECAKRESKPVRIVRRVKRKVAENVQSKEQHLPTNELDAGPIESKTSQCSQDQSINPGPSNALEVSRKSRAPRVIKKPVPFSP